MKKHVLILFIILICLCYLLVFPQDAFSAASSGLVLWFHTVMPSLLPFIILSNFLIGTRKIPVFLHHFSRFFSIIFGLSTYGAYAMLLGLFCGYPMGAKVTGDLYREQLIDKEEASYLLTFSNNPSPMFLSSFLFGQILHRTELLKPTLCILYLAAFCTLVIFRIYFHRFHEIPEHSPLTTSVTTGNYLTIMDNSIMNGFETITKLGGYIILFSIGASIIQKITMPIPALYGILPGFIELSTGVVRIAEAGLGASLEYLLLLACVSFGGLSTIIQTKGMLTGTPLSLSLYLIGKIVHTLCTLIIGCLFHIV